MQLTLEPGEVDRWLAHLLEHAFHDAATADLHTVAADALERAEHCFSRVALRGYSDDHGARFNHLNGDQTATFFYFCSNSAWRRGNDVLAAQFFLLNKLRNGLVCMYDTILPEIFLLNHTVGTMLGKATYGNYFVAYHGVTVGTDRAEMPVLGERIVMYPQSSITGRSTVGSGCVFAAKSALMRTNVPDDSVVSGVYPAVTIVPRKRDFAAHYFRG